MINNNVFKQLVFKVFNYLTGRGHTLEKWSENQEPNPWNPCAFEELAIQSGNVNIVLSLALHFWSSVNLVQLLTSKNTLQRFLIAAYELEMPDIANLIYNMCFQLNIKLGLINKSPTYNDNLFIQKSILPDLIFQNDLH